MEILNTGVKLRAESLYKRYEQEDVLKRISFEVQKGEFLAVLGPSGCGKTTLLRILIGLEKQDGGRLYKDGQDISRLAPSSRGMGIIFQNYALFPNMTVMQNVEYALKIRKDRRGTAHADAMQALELLGLSEHLSKKPYQLSGGQQQRAAIARTLALKPDIILLDEAISALDVTNRDIMKKELKMIQQTFGTTMIFITHEQEEAFSLADRVMVMNEGCIEQLDKPADILRCPATPFVREFVIAHLEEKYASLCRCTGRSIDEK